MKMRTALTIAGSDSSGGAGIQADIKTMMANGVFAMSAITAMTAQNTTGVRSIMNASPEFLADELDEVFTDIFPDAVKIGMVSESSLIRVIAQKLREYRPRFIVVDPVMVATSGAKLISGGNANALGFNQDDNSGTLSDSKIYDAVMGELKKTFRPEFLNRVDDIIVFEQLKKDDIREITVRLLENLKKRTESLGISVEFDSSAVDKIADIGFDPVYGARPIRRAIQSKIEDTLSEKMLDSSVESGKSYICKFENDEFVFVPAENTEK